MTRIVAGRAGGRRLQTPRGALTRPTADRVREALFSSLEAGLGSLEGLRFLDLYAGSGAVGLEAWSRGAAEVVLVEKDARTASLVRANARSIGCTDAVVVTESVRTFLTAPPTGGRFDVVFLDPPYAVTGADVEAHLAALGGGWLAPDAAVVVERSSRSPQLRWPAGFEPGKVRRYGETVLAPARWSEPDERTVDEEG